MINLINFILYKSYHIMESTTKISYLQNPKIKGEKLPYIKNINEIYVNLFEFKMTKPITLYQYPFTVSPEIGEGDFKIRNQIYKHCGIGKKEERKKLRYYYGECFISGNSLYALRKVNESKTFDCTLYKGGINNYIITFQPKAKERTINQEDLKKDPLTKQFIEMLIRDILHANPNLIFYKDLFVLNSDLK